MSSQQHAVIYAGRKAVVETSSLTSEPGQDCLIEPVCSENLVCCKQPGYFVEEYLLFIQTAMSCVNLHGLLALSVVNDSQLLPLLI